MTKQFHPVRYDKLSNGVNNKIILLKSVYMVKSTYMVQRERERERERENKFRWFFVLPALLNNKVIFSIRINFSISTVFSSAFLFYYNVIARSEAER